MSDDEVQRSSWWQESRLVADDRTGVRMAGALVRYRLTRPQVLIGWPVIVIALLTFGYTQDSMVGAVVLAALIFPMMTLQLYWQARRTLAKFFPAGSVHTTSFGPTSMAISGSFGTSQIRYELFKQVWVSPQAVILLQRPTRIFNVLPAELVPPGAIALIQSRLAPPGHGRRE